MPSQTFTFIQQIFTEVPNLCMGSLHFKFQIRPSGIFLYTGSLQSKHCCCFIYTRGKAKRRPPVAPGPSTVLPAPVPTASEVKPFRVLASLLFSISPSSFPSKFVRTESSPGGQPYAERLRHWTWEGMLAPFPESRRDLETGTPSSAYALVPLRTYCLPMKLEKCKKD